MKKFQKILHLPWSKAVARDDRVMGFEDALEFFRGKTLAYTEKLDGENTCMSREQITARSTTGGHDKPWQKARLEKWKRAEIDWDQWRS